MRSVLTAALALALLVSLLVWRSTQDQWIEVSSDRVETVCYEARCLMGIETGSVGAPAPTLAEAGA